MSNTPPTDVIRDGNLKASIWQNESEKGSFYTTTIAKTYKDQDGKLRDTSGFSNNDLLRVSELARNAYNRTNELRRENTPSHSTNQAPEQSRDERAARAEAYLKERRESQSRDDGYDLDR